MNLAPLLPPVPRPPHDPRSWRLDARAGWRRSEDGLPGVEIHPGGGYLALEPAPGSAALASDANGTFGGLVFPANIALAGANDLFLMRTADAVLLRFDACTCRFEEVPHIAGTGSGARKVARGAGIAIHGRRVYVCDPMDHRVLVFDLAGFSLLAVWHSPGELPQAWKPNVVAAGKDGVAVADPVSGKVMLFDKSGRLLNSGMPLGVVTNLEWNKEGRLLVSREGITGIDIVDIGNQRQLERVNRRSLLSEVLSPPPVGVFPDGVLDLSQWCDDAAYFDFQGNRLERDSVSFPQLRYLMQGSFRTEPLDSGIEGCQWDRITLKVRLPVPTRVRLFTYTANIPLPDSALVSMPDATWTEQPELNESAEGENPKAGSETQTLDLDLMVLAPAGRYLWLRLQLVGTEESTPEIDSMVVTYPRISLRRYLPAVFGQEPVAADFTDRFLGIFDRTFRGVERIMDRQAALFDPMSAPTSVNRQKDFLSWLATWVGVTLESNWPEKRRRRFLKQAVSLFPWRGTPRGLRKALKLYLGVPDTIACDAPGDCVPCQIRSSEELPGPCLVLEHFTLRRWLFTGYGKLGQEATLWGAGIANRSQLGSENDEGTARLGVSQLRKAQDPRRDPFHHYAHKFTVFVPARLGGSPAQRASLDRFIAQQKPAHTVHQVSYVSPRFRVGVQSMIGYDAVVARYPSGVVLGCNSDNPGLGRATVLDSGELPADTRIIGRRGTVGDDGRLL